MKIELHYQCDREIFFKTKIRVLILRKQKVTKNGYTVNPCYAKDYKVTSVHTFSLPCEVLCRSPRSIGNKKPPSLLLPKAREGKVVVRGTSYI